MGLIKNLKNKHNLEVQFLHCDNAGEYIAFEEAHKRKGGSDSKYTAPGMPQQNGCVKRKLTTLFNQVCALLNSSKFHAYLQNGLRAKAVNTTMLFENKYLTPTKILSPFQHFLEGKEKHPDFNTEIWWNVYYHLQGQCTLG